MCLPGSVPSIGKTHNRGGPCQAFLVGRKQKSHPPLIPPSSISSPHSSALLASISCFMLSLLLRLNISTFCSLSAVNMLYNMLMTPSTSSTQVPPVVRPIGLGPQSAHLVRNLELHMSSTSTLPEKNFVMSPFMLPCAGRNAKYEINV